MIELLRTWSHWLEGFADSPWAVVILVANSFTESIFNPIPPDPLFIGMSVLNQNLALVFAALVTISSVLGALVGHWLGMRLGRPVVLRFISEQKLGRVEAMFQRYGSWTVLVAAFTPIPYKVFAITAGVLELDRRSFLIASVIGRGARFFLLGGLIFFFGAAMQEFIASRFEIITVVFSILLVAGLVALYLIMRWRRSNAATMLGEAQPQESD